MFQNNRFEWIFFLSYIEKWSCSYINSVFSNIRVFINKSIFNHKIICNSECLEQFPFCVIGKQRHKKIHTSDWEFVLSCCKTWACPSQGFLFWSPTPWAITPENPTLILVWARFLQDIDGLVAMLSGPCGVYFEVKSEPDPSLAPKISYSSNCLSGQCLLSSPLLPWAVRP